MDKKGWDLHVHSTCSDGTYTPKELIDEAKAKSLTGLAITDHDTVAAYTQNLYDYAKENAIGLITGVEFSTIDDKTPVHILGYRFDTDHKAVTDLCQAHVIRRQERNQAILAKLKDYGIEISYDELLAQGGHTIGRPHIAKLLIEKGVVNTIKEAFNRWIGDDQKCYARGRIFSPKEAIETIHKAGGLAFLAHPILLKKRAVIKGLLNRYKFDGMECYYGTFSEDKKKQMVEIAGHFNILTSGGSDFHGSTKSYVRLGVSYTNENEIERIMNHGRM